MQSDSTGTFNFYAPDGRYDLTAVVSGFSKIITDVEIADITEANTGDTPAVLTCQKLNNIQFASAYSGADWTVKVIAADAALGTKGGQIWVDKSAGVSGSQVITLHNSLVFIDDAEYTHKGINVQTGGIFIQGMGFSSNGSINFGTRLTYTGSVGSDALSILGIIGGHLDKIVVRNILINGNGTARYGIRCEKADAGSLEDVRIEGCVTANTYWQDALDWKWYNVASTFMSGYGCIFDGLSGSFDWYGGQFEQGNASSNPQIVISGANNRMSFNGLDMDFNANCGGFILIQGQDGANSSFLGATAGIGQGRPINIRIGDCVMNYGGAAAASLQGADILITDASAAQQPQNIYIENCQFLGSGVGAVSIKTDQATQVFIDKIFSNGHTTGTAATVVATANSSLIYMKRVISGDSNRTSEPVPGASIIDQQITAVSNLQWQVLPQSGWRIGPGTTALPALAFNADTSSGWSRPGAGYWRWSNGGADVFLLSPGGPIINSTKAYGFSNGDSFANSTLTGLSWISQGTIGIGNATAGDTSGNLQLTKISKYNTVTTAGNGVSAISGATSQRAETAADTNVLTVTPPAVAGQYRLNVMLSISAATAATLGWTATWKDSNSTAQAPTNLALFQSGVAAPALTFTTSVAGNYYGIAVIDIDNSATNIVIKLTFTGTSFAGKVSTTIERLI